MVEPPDERRRDARYHARFVVRFAGKSEARRALEAFSANISAGGLCLRSSVPHQVGEALQLELELSAEEQHLELEGVVAWVRRDTMGVRFVNLSVADRERLLELSGRLASRGG